LTDAQYAPAGCGLAVVKDRIGNRLWDTRLAQCGGEGPAEVEPGPPGQSDRFLIADITNRAIRRSGSDHAVSLGKTPLALGRPPGPQTGLRHWTSPL
jgi:hypothetical protein